MSEKCVLLDSSIKSLLMILFITSLGTIIHKKLSVRLLNHTNTLSQLTILHTFNEKISEIRQVVWILCEL